MRVLKKGLRLVCVVYAELFHNFLRVISLISVSGSPKPRPEYDVPSVLPSQRP